MHNMQNRSTFIFFVFLIIVSSCTSNKTELNKTNPCEVAIYEDMLQMNSVNINDIQIAFDTYATTHKVSEMETRWFNKRLKKMKPYADQSGNYLSPTIQYNKLLAFRSPTENAPMAPEAIVMNDPPTMIPFSIPNPDGLGSWENIGPFGNPDVRWSATGSGALDHIEMHPTDPATMYASSRNAGLWKTTNYGQNWINITKHFPTPHTHCAEVCTEDPQKIYLSTGGNQVYYTTDEGQNWENRSTGIEGKIYDMHSDPTDSDRVIAATLSGIYVTTDAGQNWTQKITDQFTDIDISEDFNFIVVSKNNENITPTLFFSQDKGDTWIERDIITSPAIVDKMYIAFHEPITGPIEVFAYGIDDDNSPTRFIGLWKSDYEPNPTGSNDYFDFVEVQHPTYTYPNGAVPLTYANNADGYNAETGDYYGSVNPYSSALWVSEFWVSPNNPDRLLTMREKFWGSEDGGIIWDFKPSYGGSNWADNRFITMNTAKDTLYWCNDGGVWSIAEEDLFPTQADIDASGLSKSAYMNSKVVYKNGDISLQEGSQMDVSLMNKDVFMTGGQDVGQVFERAGRSSHVASADVYRGRIKPTDDKLFITGSLNVQIDGVDRSIYNAIEPDRGDHNRLYGFTTGTVELARSPAGVDGWAVNGFKGEDQANTGGHSWTPVNKSWEIVNISGTGITSLKTHTFEQSRANPEVAYLGDEVGNRIFMTSNLSASSPTWTELANAPTSNKYRIATHALYENIVVAATADGVFVSKNSGQDWYARKGFPESDVKAVLLDKDETLGIYVMTGMNVYYTNEAKEEWTEFNKSLPLFQNQDMRIGYYENGDNRLYVAKYGSGVWVSPLQSVLDANADMPIADFKIHGLSSSVISVGESVQLIDLSVNAESISWTLENGVDVINIGDISRPSTVLNTAGYYKVTLIATNTNGADSEIKEYYIKVDNLVDLDCTPAYDNDLSWFIGFDDIRINDDNFNVPSLANYYEGDKTYSISLNETSSIFFDDNYNGGWNMWANAWIDYNNDGIFDENTEEIMNSGGQLESFTGSFTPPVNATTFTTLRMRVAGRQTNNAPIPCETHSSRQVIDLKVIILKNVIFTSMDIVLPNQDVELSTIYTDAQTVSSSGFILSTINGEFDKDNGSIYEYSGAALSNNDSYEKTLSALDANTTYYYRPYLYDMNGIHYGSIDSFSLAPKVLPMAESILGLNQGSDEWEFTGMIFPLGTQLTTAFFEHGTDNFNTSTAIDLSNLDVNGQQLVSELVTIPNGSTEYKYRIRLEYNGSTIYSNIVTLDLGQTICTPTIGPTVWYKRWSRIILNGTTHNESTSAPYEDATNITFDFDAGGSYMANVHHVNSGWWNLTFRIFIDLNNDNDFDDLGELVGIASPTAQDIDVPINIPSTLLVRGKDLRMRVVGSESSPSLPCEIAIGNIKDFTAHIDRCTPIKVLNESNMPFVDGAYYHASQEIQLQQNLVIPTGITITLDAPTVRASGEVTQKNGGKIIVKEEGCEE